MTLAERPTDAITIARALAVAHPEASLACPICVTTVRASNLAGHLDKVHAGERSTMSITDGRIRWQGADRASRTVLLALPFVILAVGSSVVAALGAGLTDLTVGSVVGAALLAFVPLVLSLLDKLPARLELDGQTLRVTWGLGLITRALPLRGPIEVGALRGSRSVGVSVPYSDTSLNVESQDTVVGGYLRFSDKHRAITVGVRKQTGIRKRWAEPGWRAGPARRRWDITVDRVAMVELEYQLAGLGLLSVR